MSFWDASALLPLIVREPASGRMTRFAQQEGALVVWWGSLVECASALERRYRTGQVKTGEKRRFDALLDQLSAAWSEVQPSQALRLRARRLLASHDLRAADALQLAAALVWAEEQPGGREFICLDNRLREAARREGFLVLPEEDLPS